MKKINRKIKLGINLVFYWVISLFMIFYLHKSKGNHTYAFIYYHQKIVYRTDLKENKRFTIKQIGNQVVFEIRNGKIRIAQNDCPKKICVHMGWISKPYESIICLPKKIVIKIVSPTEKRIEATTG